MSRVLNRWLTGRAIGVILIYKLHETVVVEKVANTVRGLCNIASPLPAVQLYFKSRCIIATLC